MKVKKREFLALTQGSSSVTEYLNKFNNLSRYSLHDVATEERKIYHFLGGLHTTLRCQLSMPDLTTASASMKPRRSTMSSSLRSNALGSPLRPVTNPPGTMTTPQPTS